MHRIYPMLFIALVACKNDKTPELSEIEKEFAEMGRDFEKNMEAAALRARTLPEVPEKPVTPVDCEKTLSEAEVIKACGGNLKLKTQKPSESDDSCKRLFTGLDGVYGPHVELTLSDHGRYSATTWELGRSRKHKALPGIGEEATIDTETLAAIREIYVNVLDGRYIIHVDSKDNGCSPEGLTQLAKIVAERVDG